MLHPTEVIPTPCEKCGVIFSRKKYSVKRFCSVACRPKTGPKSQTEGLSASEWIAARQRIAKAQNELCAVCGKSMQRPSLDHDHATGALRGVICSTCNAGLGLLGDSYESVSRAAEYLRHYEERHRLLTWEGPMLSGWIEAHKKYQLDAYGVDLDALSEEERVKYLDDMLRAAMLEIAEGYNEFSWKSWAKSQYINRDALVGELIDVVIFIGNAFAALGVSTDEVNDRYRRKMGINADRQLFGYDGVTTKCPKCRRALDDEAVACTVDYCAEVD